MDSGGIPATTCESLKGVQGLGSTGNWATSHEPGTMKPTMAPSWVWG